MRRMLRSLLAAAVPCAVALACASEPPRPARAVVRFTVGTPGGGIYALADALVREYRRSFPNLDFVVRDRPTAVGNVTTVARGDADFAFSYADTAYSAYVAGARGPVPPIDQIRGVAVLQLAPIHLVVGHHVAARSIRGLAGLRVGVGPPMSSTLLEASLLLDTYGVDRSQMHLESLPFDQAAERLSRGTLDAFFEIASYPAESVRRALSDGATLVPLEGPVIDVLRHQSVFLNRTVIPAHTYPRQATSIHTLGVHNLLVCRRDLDEGLVHELTGRLFELLPSLVTDQDSLRLVDLHQAPATPIPLHDGAARYYRERELER
jgi:TRAP transporter TAXI family solute receptor